MVRGYHPVRAGHIDDNHRRLPGNVVAHMSRKKPGIAVVAAAGRRSDDDSDCFACIEILSACTPPKEHAARAATKENTRPIRLIALSADYARARSQRLLCRSLLARQTFPRLQSRNDKAAIWKLILSAPLWRRLPAAHGSQGKGNVHNVTRLKAGLKIPRFDTAEAVSPFTLTTSRTLAFQARRT